MNARSSPVGPKRPLLPLAAGLASLLATGCVVPAPSSSVPVSLPERHRGADPLPPSGPTLGDLAWWQVFSDPTLVALVREAVANNDDLEVAAARIAEARALVGVEAAGRLPQVDGQLGAERSKSSGATGSDFDLYRTSLSAAVPISWEIDLWGRVRWSTAAASARWVATIEDRNDVMRVLVADVAQAYLELRALDEERAIAADTVATRGGTRELFSTRLEAGAGSRVEVARANAELAFAAQAVPTIERAVAQKENQIAVLLGRNPGPIARGSVDAGIALPHRPPDLPSAILRRRPDVRAAEAALVAASADVGASRADLYPRLSLTALLGLEGRSLSDLVERNATAGSVGATLVGPLFDGGARQGRLCAADARWRGARVEYERAVRVALREVADALVATVKLREIAAHASARVEALEESTTLATQRYEGDQTSYFEVLDAQRDLFPARLEQVRRRKDQRVAVVQLFRALGGGWDAPSASCPPSPSPTAPAAAPR